MPNNPIGCPVVHKQVPAKVTAYVDEGIRELVEIVNSFDEMQTIESCEGEENGNAYIYALYGASRKQNLCKLIYFVDYLVHAIWEESKQRQHILLLDEVCIAIEYLGKTFPLIGIEFPKGRMKEVISVFSSLKIRHDFCSWYKEQLRLTNLSPM